MNGKRLPDELPLEIPTDAALYRDILPIIVSHVSIQTWGRMKQCCRLFRDVLVVYPLEAALRAQLILPPPVPYTGAYELFFPCMRRLLYTFDKLYKRASLEDERVKSHASFDLKVQLGSLKRFRDNIGRDSKRTRLFFIETFYVMYPSGFVCDRYGPGGNIFSDAPECSFEMKHHQIGNSWWIVLRSFESVPPECKAPWIIY